MDVSASGDPIAPRDDTQIAVRIDLRPGTLTLNRDGNSFEAYLATVEFAAADEDPWLPQEVTFSAKGPDGKPLGLRVDLLNEACDGPRDGVPPAIWKVVALAATTAGDLGLTYSVPSHP